MRSGGVDGAVPGTTVGVATALDELKSRGSALLVVGTVPAAAYTRLSARLLGEGPDRRRLVVEHRRSPDQRFDHVTRWTPEWTRVFRCRLASRRSTAAADAPEARGTPWTAGAPPVSLNAETAALFASTSLARTRTMSRSPSSSTGRLRTSGPLSGV